MILKYFNIFLTSVLEENRNNQMYKYSWGRNLKWMLQKNSLYPHVKNQYLMKIKLCIRL